MAYSYDQVFAADPANPANIAQNAAITIYAPGDPTMTPLTITDPSGGALTNPITVNANGFGSAFQHATLDRVAWFGGGFTGFFTSYEGMKDEAVAAREAAESAAAEAGAQAVVRLDELIAAGSFEGPAGPLTNLTVGTVEATPGNPLTDDIVASEVTNGTATKAALTATLVPKGKAPQAVERAKTDRGLKTWDAHLAYEATPRLHIAGHSVVAGSSSDGDAFKFTTIMGTRLAAWRNVTVTSNGNSGWTSTQLVNSAPNLTVKTGCVVLMCMLNDYHNSVPSATTKANLQALINLYRASPQPAPGPSIVIVGEWLRTDTASPVESWDNYLKVAKEVAEADPDAIYVDLRERLGSVADDPADMNLFTGDGVHPGQRGHAFIADALLAELQRGRIYGTGQSYPKQITVDMSTMPEVAVGTISAPIATGGANGWVRETDGVLNSSMEYTLLMAAGTWSMDLFHRLGSDRGQYFVDIDGVQVGGLKADGYNATASDSRDRSTGYTISTSGAHKIRIRMGAKNASSSAYKGSLARMVWTQTA